MIIDSEIRVQAFFKARGIHAELGNLFQNEMDITSGDADLEIAICNELIKEIESYKQKIITIGNQAMMEKSDGKSNKSTISDES